MFRSLKIISIILLTLSLVFSSQIVIAVSDSLQVNQGVTEEVVSLPTEDSYLIPSSKIILRILNLKISEIKTNSATVSWQTERAAFCQLYYGETKEYSKGSISEQDFSLTHSIIITDLFPATMYYFKITCMDISGARSETVERSFTTLVPFIVLPLSVTNLEAIPGNEQIELKWKNPVDPNFEGVRIARSRDFYPLSPLEGDIIYEGKAEGFIDTGLENGIRYYYTAFSYDKIGNFSSGIVASAIPIPIDIPIVILPPPSIDIPVALPIHPDLEKITINDFDFYQKGRRVSLDKVEADEPLFILLDYEKVPEVLKTIMISLKDSQDKYFSFLLRINEDKTAYEAAILAPEPGRYLMTILILDYKNQARRKIEAFLEIIGKDIIEERLFPLLSISLISFLAIALVFVAVILKKSFVLARRKRESYSYFGMRRE